jgi:hypothetical protein
MFTSVSARTTGVKDVEFGRTPTYVCSRAQPVLHRLEMPQRHKGNFDLISFRHVGHAPPVVEVLGGQVVLEIFLRGAVSIKSRMVLKPLALRATSCVLGLMPICPKAAQKVTASAMVKRLGKRLDTGELGRKT